MNYLQFKLTTNDEIICQVVDEPEGDDINLVIRNAMKIFTIEGQDGVRYYTFRPWMTYQDREGYMQLLNYTHIVGEAKPSDMLVAQYLRALQVEQKSGDEREQLLEDKFAEIKKKIEETVDSPDDDNVIDLFSRFDKDKLH